MMMSVESSRLAARRLLAICALAVMSNTSAFIPAYSSRIRNAGISALHAEDKLTLIQDQEVIATPIAFRLDQDSSNKKENEESVIMCYVDCIAKINDVDYSVG